LIFFASAFAFQVLVQQRLFAVHAGGGSVVSCCSLYLGTEIAHKFEIPLESDERLPGWWCATFVVVLAVASTFAGIRTWVTRVHAIKSRCQTSPVRFQSCKVVLVLLLVLLLVALLLLLLLLLLLVVLVLVLLLLLLGLLPLIMLMMMIPMQWFTRLGWRLKMACAVPDAVRNVVG